MAKFNFIDVSVDGYSFVWQQRFVLARLAALPVLIKIASFALIYLLGLEDHVLRQGFIFMPAYFAEGWLLCFAVRMAVYDEGWAALNPARLHLITSGMVLYVLIKVVSVVAFGAALKGHHMADHDVPTQEAPPMEGEPLLFLAAAALLLFSVWAFRFLWFYVPLAMGLKFSEFWARSKAFATSFYMMGTWLLCFAPLALLLVVIAGLLQGAFPDAGDVRSPVYMGLMIIVQAALELVILLVTSVALAYGISDMMGIKRKT